MTKMRAAFAIGFAALIAGLPARAADLALRPLPPVDGVPCDSPEVASFPSVWLGHFSGSRSVYPGPGSHILLEYYDQKLCFPSARTCGRHIGGMRRVFHRPEGYFTCLPIR